MNEARSFLAAAAVAEIPFSAQPVERANEREDDIEGGERPCDNAN